MACEAILGQETEEATHRVASGLGKDEGQDLGRSDDSMKMDVLRDI